MGSVNKKNLRNLHARRYIQEVFATRLRDEGFVCPDDKLLWWYRLNSDEIVNSICFFSRWTNLPLMLEIGYGIHPLFVKPYYSCDVYISNPPIDERFYTVDIGFGSEKRHYAPFLPDVLVYTPKKTEKGLMLLSVEFCLRWTVLWQLISAIFSIERISKVPPLACPLLWSTRPLS